LPSDFNSEAPDFALLITIEYCHKTS
jgi:hypothetical protein